MTSSETHEIITRLDGLNRRFDKIDERFEAVDRRFDKVDERFEAVDQRFDKVDERLDGMDRQFDGVNQRLDSLDRRFDAHERANEREFASIAVAIAEVQGATALHVDGLRAEMVLRFGRVDERLDGMGRRFDRVEDKLDRALGLRVRPTRGARGPGRRRR